MAKLEKTPKIEDLITIEKQKRHETLVKTAELNICMFLHEHNLPFLLADHLQKFLPHICPDSEVAKSLSCRRTKATYITNECLAKHQMKELAENLKTKHFSLIIDETTDIATEKSLVLVVRYYDDTKMAVQDKFFGLIKPEDFSAEAIFDTIVNYIRKQYIPMDNMIGLAADNASVMMGKQTGVQARFRRILPNIFILGCICHSFHLCSSAASKKLPKNLEDSIREIYNYFSNSSKRIDRLKECQVFINMKPHKLLHPAQTRWLSLQAAVDRVLENWNPLVMFFTNECFEQDLNSCNKILENLNHPIYKMYFKFLSYVLDIVNRLNLEFQSEKTKIHLVQKRVRDLYRTLLRNFIKKEHIDKTPIQNINPSNPRSIIELEKMYLGAQVELMINDFEVNDVRDFKLRCLDFYIELCTQIKNRFDFENPVLNYVSIFDPKTAVSGEIGNIVKDTTTLFPNLVRDIEQLNSEWRLLGDIDQFKQCNLTSFEEFWNHIFNAKNDLNGPLFPQLCLLVKGIISLPHSSAAAERVFSQLFLLKTKTRNRLDVDTCCSILHCKELMNNETCYTWTPSTDLLKRKFRD
nr:uncharacterized protein LOC111503289 [Leptinotarsa decemlineata]